MFNKDLKIKIKKLETEIESLNESLSAFQAGVANLEKLKALKEEYLSFGINDEKITILIHLNKIVVYTTVQGWGCISNLYSDEEFEHKYLCPLRQEKLKKIKLAVDYGVSSKKLKEILNDK